MTDVTTGHEGAVAKWTRELDKAEERGWNAALAAVEEAVDRLPLYDETDRIVTMGGGTRELRTMADAAEAVRTRALSRIAALRKPSLTS